MKKLLLIFSIAFSINIKAQCWSQISAGWFHTMAIKADGTLWAWGANTNGQLGNGAFGQTAYECLPIKIGTDNNWSQVSCGSYFTLALKTDGTLWAWGSNAMGQLGDNTIIDKNIPIQIGTVTNWSKISAGFDHSLAIKTDGTLWAWGSNIFGQAGIGSSTINKVYVPTQIGTATNWSQVSASCTSNAFSLAIKTDGTLWAWGDNFFGQLGDNTTVDKLIPTKIGTATNWSKINAGDLHSLALKSDGTLWSWGYNNSGQLGNGAITNKYIPTKMGTATDWNQISAGKLYSIATKNNGTLWAWGDNVTGQLGDGTLTGKLLPTQIGIANNWNQICAGVYHTLSTKTDDSLWAWGANDGNHGQLGIGCNIGNTGCKTTPTLVNSCLTTSVEENQFEDLFSIYPNPANDFLSINTDESLLNNSTIEIYDAIGKLIVNEKLTILITKVNIYKLPNGIYTVRVYSNGKQFVKRIIKE